jgi:hypothetical protein
MSVENLRLEVTEYSLRIEEVLSGMDRVLTDLSNRVAAFEGLRQAPQLPHPTYDALVTRVHSLEEQVTTLGLAIGELLGNKS